ncbi:hypothetical protein P7A58_15515, partial [Clostridium perfringens]|nr:hypothetical protein [Clostridium perfringens]
LGQQLLFFALQGRLLGGDALALRFQQALGALRAALGGFLGLALGRGLLAHGGHRRFVGRVFARFRFGRIARQGGALLGQRARLLFFLYLALGGL